MTTTGNNYDHLPVLSGDQARSIDLEVTEKLGRVRVLECVATRLADFLQYHLHCQQPILFVAGKGNNGANSLAAARILHFRGYQTVQVVSLVDPATDRNLLRPNMQEQLQLFTDFVGSTYLHSLDYAKIQSWQGIVVDGILGTGISEPPRGIAEKAIVAINKSEAQVVSIDVPSGLNHVTGQAPGVCVRATWTLNLHMLKSGQLKPAAKEFVGELWSAETALGFVSFGPDLAPKFAAFYRLSPIRKVF